METYPVTIIYDRYGGTYSGGKWLAFNKYEDDIPIEISGGDTEAFYFWKSYKGIVGKGASPNEAYENLKNKIKTK